MPGANINIDIRHFILQGEETNLGTATAIDSIMTDMSLGPSMKEINLLSGSVKTVSSETPPPDPPLPSGHSNTRFQDFLNSLKKPQDPISSPISDEVTCVCASRLGAVLGLKDGRVVLIKPDGDRDDIARHKSKVTNLCVGGQVVVSAAEHEKVSLWTLDVHLEGEKREKETPERFQTETEGFQTAKLVSITPDGHRLAYGPSPLKVWSLPVKDLPVWDPLKMTQAAAFHGDPHITCLAISPDGQRVVTSVNKGLKVFSIPECGVAILEHEVSISHFSISPNSTFVTCGSSDGRIQIWDLRTKELMYISEGCPVLQGVSCLCISPDSRFLIWAADEPSLKVLMFADMKQVAVLPGHHDVVEQVQAMASHYIVSRDLKGVVKVWSLEEMKEMLTLQGEVQSNNSTFCVGIHEKWVFSAIAEAKNMMWNLDPALAKFKGHTDLVSCVSVLDDQVATGSHDKTVKIWSLKNKILLRTFLGHTDKVLCLSTLSSRKVLSAGADKSIREWDQGTQSRVITTTRNLSSMCSFPDGKVLVALAGNEIELHDFESLGKPGCPGHRDRVTCILRLSDKTWISGSRDATLKRWNAIDDKGGVKTEVLATFCGHMSSVNCVAVTSDELLAVSGSDDNTVRVWDLNTMKQKAVLYGHKASVKCIDTSAFQKQEAVSSDKTTVKKQYAVSGADDYTVKVWDLDEMILVTSIRTECRCSSLAAIKEQQQALLGFPDGSIKLLNLTSMLPEFRKLSYSHLGNKILMDWVSSQYGQAMKDLESGEPISLEIAGHLILPHCFNALHICTYYHHSNQLKHYLTNGIPIINGAFGSPLTIALNQQDWMSVDVIVQYLTNQQDSLVLTAYTEITDDLPELIRRRASHLTPFFNNVFRKSRCVDIPRSIALVKPLPRTVFSEKYSFGLEEFAKVEEGKLVVLNTEEAEFKVSLFKWNFSAGSVDSLEFLRALNSTHSSILTTPFIEALIVSKWKSFRTLIIVLSVLYTTSLVILMLLFTYSWNTKCASSVFISMNVFFLMYEVVQCLVNGWEYFKDPWNYADIIRYLASLFWGVLASNDADWLYLRLFVLCICFYRGFHYFNAFHLAMRYLRVALKVVKEIYFSFVILSYILLTFALIGSGITTIADIWTVIYSMLLGNFRTTNLGIAPELCYVAVSLLNMIFMFNLLTTFLVITPDKVAELRQRLQLIIEFESLFFWKRTAGTRSFLVNCKVAEENRTEPKIEDSKLEQLNAKIDRALAQLQEARETRRLHSS